MDWLLDEPGVVLVCVTLAAFLIIVEVALPTIGIAATLALLVSAVAIAGIARQDAAWWPLLGPATGVAVWAVILVRQRRSPAAEVAAAAAFALGGAAFAIVNDDIMSMVVTALGTPLLGLGFPRLHDAATRLLQRPAQVGMDALVGQIAAVDRWDHERGVVLLDGSRWNAATVRPFALHQAPVTVIGYRGTTVTVAPGTGDEPWAPPGPSDARRLDT